MLIGSPIEMLETPLKFLLSSWKYKNIASNLALGYWFTYESLSFLLFYLSISNV